MLQKISDSENSPFKRAFFAKRPKVLYHVQTSEQIISPKILPTITSFKNFLQVWENILVDSF